MIFDNILVQKELRKMKLLSTKNKDEGDHKYVG